MASDAPVSSLRPMFPQELVEDLARSGLEPADLKVRALTGAEIAATNAPMSSTGYVIPYFNAKGEAQPFYRVKLYNAADNIKYRQIADTPNYIYFPPRLNDLLKNKPQYIMITEGEKKAACAVKHNFPCVGLSGVDSWRSRTIILPKDTNFNQKGTKQVAAKLPSGQGILEGVDTIAIGLQEIIDYSLRHDVPLIMCFDTDELGVKPEVMRAAASFGYELRHRGIPMRNIRIMELPGNPGEKVGLDDFLVDGGDDAVVELSQLLHKCINSRSAFPVHPNVRHYVNQRLQRTHLSRSEQMSVAMAILSDLDQKGQRLASPDEGAIYYFDNKAKTLVPVNFTGRPDFAESEFGAKLYRDYNLSVNDQRVLGWLMTQFSGEEPILQVRPEKVMAWRGDTLYYQVNDGTTAKVTAEHISLIDNGDDGVLFVAGLTDGIETKDFEGSLRTVAGDADSNWWYEVLQEARLKTGDANAENQKRLLSLLYYISPFFYRWRGTQLPVEIMTGEPGSGKSTLYTLRLNILTGMAKLRNAPNDLKDWNAGLASTGALHVTDNVQLTNNDLRQRLSDEICRLVTETNPSIEQRKLYADTAQIKIPVRCVFALTAVRQPFQNVDIIQRSIITELDKGVDTGLRYEAEWDTRHLMRRGGRSNWLAHQLFFVQKMLQLAKTEWREKYQAKYRLINVEQLLMLASKASGWDSSWIPSYLEESRDKKVSENDWTLQGLHAFLVHMKECYPQTWSKGKFPANTISEWASAVPDFEKCHMLTEARSLTRYLAQHKHTVATTVGMIPAGEIGGVSQFKFQPVG